MSLLASVNEAAVNSPYSAYPPLPAGLSSNLTWSSNTAGSNYSVANISVPGITSNSVISAAIQSSTYADTNNAWLMSATPTANNIAFNCYTPPVTPSSFVIAWAVAKF